jgi:hypothetical protein
MQKYKKFKNNLLSYEKKNEFRIFWGWIEVWIEEKIKKIT